MHSYIKHALFQFRRLLLQDFPVFASAPEKISIKSVYSVYTLLLFFLYIALTYLHVKIIVKKNDNCLLFRTNCTKIMFTQTQTGCGFVTKQVTSFGINVSEIIQEWTFPLVNYEKQIKCEFFSIYDFCSFVRLAVLFTYVAVFFLL